MAYKYFLKSLVAATLLMSAPLLAQPENQSSSVSETPSETRTLSSPKGETPTLWVLRGGGEILGYPVKETTDAVFVDVGPRIVEIPVSSVLESRLFGEQVEDSTPSRLESGRGIFDPTTGSVIFEGKSPSSRTAGMSQQQILEQVKKGVVLVSNPGGLGTGWIIDAEQGLLVTNHHVIGRETYQTVTIFVKNGPQWDRVRIDDCEVQSFSDLLDIAIVKLNMEAIREKGITLYPLTIADPSSLEAGEKVFAVGNPGMGRMVLEHTISEGIVSSLQRNFGNVVYLQTTAAVNPGNSGGPLINEQGEVVGLITLKATFQEGVAFALPVTLIDYYLKYQRAFSVEDQNRNKGFRYYRPE